MFCKLLELVSLLSNLNFSYPSKVFCLFVRLGSRIFHSYGDVTITGEGLPILTFIVTHLLWDILYNGHHQGPVTLTPIAERLAVELSLPVFLLRSVAAGPSKVKKQLFMSIFFHDPGARGAHIGAV